jgi:hypothetical protein
MIQAAIGFLEEADSIAVPDVGKACCARAHRHGRGLDTRGLARLLGEFDVSRAGSVCAGAGDNPQRWSKRLKPAA